MMLAPLFLPYFEQPHWDIPFPIVGELTIHAFGVLVAIALVFGTWVSRWHGQQLGLNPTNVVDCATWTAISGFIVAHLVSVIFYFPDRLAEDPLQLIYVWNGLSSFGGFIGGVVGCVWFCKKRGLQIMPHVDSIVVGLTGGWMFGRMGCTVAHDHPGLPTDFFLAFDHPQRGPIHDLGFYELLFTIFLFSFVLIIRRKRWPHGTIPALVMMLYAPVRFSFDFLRVADAKYLGLTPGQWLAIGMLLGGVALLLFARKLDLRPSFDSAPAAGAEQGSERGDGGDGEGARESKPANDAGRARRRKKPSKA